MRISAVLKNDTIRLTVAVSNWQELEKTSFWIFIKKTEILCSSLIASYEFLYDESTKKWKNSQIFEWIEKFLAFSRIRPPQNIFFILCIQIQVNY